MLCVEKLQKIILASVLGIILMLTGVGSLKLAFLLQVSVMIILISSSLTGSCYITKVLNSAFPLCSDKNKEKR